MLRGVRVTGIDVAKVGPCSLVLHKSPYLASYLSKKDLRWRGRAREGEGQTPARPPNL